MPTEIEPRHRLPACARRHTPRLRSAWQHGGSTIPSPPAG